MTTTEIKATFKEVDRKVIIKELKRKSVEGVKVYATGYK